MERSKKSFFWLMLVLGIFCIIGSIAAITNPGVTLITLVVVIAAVAFVRGIEAIILYFDIKSYGDFKPVMMLVVGILEIVLGVLFLSDIASGVATLGVMVAFWLIFDSIFRLTNAGYYKNVMPGMYVLMIILNIISLVVGVMLLFEPLVSAMTIPVLLSVSFAVFGIQSIVIAFTSRNA
ncbi:uncharacterized membrane protein HdeD (DUF308 family) [Breznakia blatticola]|uniref:Uncharacterized membrane protein HdeD (DUF308 family) n=1 Tax=Breznakia blatticola TaxID=1754012 RepID=A0A4R8A848_9FIRM|nr:DUF308 domain-containing protein [Breznakia blatticola]TDW26051.1 uncharacterized membrane protein HdeD (DUF308 family) [Breznakia blatticola]